MRDLGTGITFFWELEEYIIDNLDLIDVIEIEPQTYWIHSDRYRIEEGFEAINNIPCEKLVHSISLPVGNATIDEEQLSLLKQIVDELKPQWASEHLSFNKANNSNEEFDTGFFLPPYQSEEGIEHCVRMVNRLKSMQLPIAIETGVNYLDYEFDVGDGEFVSQVVQRADCGILLDLHNVWTNELNGREKVKDFLAKIPLERVWEVHLAGGLEEDGYWLDAHSGSIPDELFEIGKDVIPTLPNLHAIIFEVYPSYVNDIDYSIIREQLMKLKQLWRIKGSKKRVNKVRIEHYQSSVQYTEWLDTLGMLVTGQSVDNNLARRISKDNAIAIYKKLIRSFRGSMLIKTLPLTSRLLMLTLADKFNELLEEFWSKNTPKQFAADEAKAFINYLDIDLKYLKEVLAFEEALLLANIEGKSTTIIFDHEPITILNSLAERKLPEDVQEGKFRIDVLPNKVVYINEDDKIVLYER